MKTKAIFTSIFIATMLLAASPADAQRGEGHGTAEKGTCDHIPDLTEDQEEQIDEIKADYFSAIKDLKADMDIKTAEKRKLMIADEPDKSAINAKIDEISTIHSQMAKIRVEKHLAIRDVLTEEQKNAFDVKMHKGHKRGNMHKDCMQDKPAMHKDCMHNKSKMHKNK
ncbi:MAG: Spy/CpxP family protein refolding chaperone [Candidatus Delongbacteria bacterium]|nr:Spy/CpxP family protein refolding chaperone [Candidatus Delongbacteria bacterium]